MGTVLELDKDDLGLTGAGINAADVIMKLLLPVAERNRELLVCVESSKGQRCKAELSGVKMKPPGGPATTVTSPASPSAAH
ncbi:hypothetical protein ACWEPM_36965 [Streptomyces sp. NPDC004244]